MSIHRYARLLAAAAVVLMVSTGCSTGSAEKPAGETKRLKIALSNSFIGNQWRVEMENVFKAACAMPPYLEQVECSIYNAGNDVSTQSRQISNLIRRGVNGTAMHHAYST